MTLIWSILQLALLVCLALAPHPAAGQLEDEQRPERRIEQIVITAEKRETVLQETPVAISAFPEEALEIAGLNTFSDISFLVPNTHYSQTLTGGANITIRGVSTLGGDAATSFHIDGNYQASNLIPAALTFFDIERVEVVRGPQGTLYGRNSTGGAINVITRRPTNQFEMFGDVQGGSFAQVFSRGALNLPIVDDLLSSRFSFFQESREGYTRNLATPDRGNDPNDADRWGFRGQLRLTTDGAFDDRIDWTVRGVYGESGGVGPMFKQLGPFPDEVVLLEGIPPVDIYVFASENPVDNREIRLDTIGQVAATTWGVNTTFDWDLPAIDRWGGAKFTLNSSYLRRDLMSASDADGSDVLSSNDPRAPDSPLVTNISTTRAEEYVVDMHLASAEGGVELHDRVRMDWLLGFFYLGFETDTSIFAPATIPIELMPPPDPPPVLIFNTSVPLSNRNNSDSIGIYTQEEIHLFDDWSLVLGMRWNLDRKRRVQDDGEARVGPICAIPAIKARDKDNWSEFTGKVGLNWQPTDENLLYFHWTPGYKAGTIETAVGSSTMVDPMTGCPTLVPVDNARPEHIFAYEIGSKNSFFDRRLQANFSAFYYDYTDLQVAQLFEATAIIQNAAEARNFGFELELVTVPIDNLQLVANFTYLNAEFGQYFGFLVEDTDTILDFSGNPMLQSPPWTVLVSAQYDWDMGRYGTLIPYIQLFGSGEVHFRPGNEEQLRQARQGIGVFVDNGKQDPYFLMNLRVTWRSSNERFYVEGFVNNATDADVVNNKIAGSALLGTPIWTFFDAPRTWGIRTGFSW